MIRIWNKRNSSFFIFSILRFSAHLKLLEYMRLLRWNFFFSFGFLRFFRLLLKTVVFSRTIRWSWHMMGVWWRTSGVWERAVLWMIRDFRADPWIVFSSLCLWGNKCHNCIYVWCFRVGGRVFFGGFEDWDRWGFIYCARVLKEGGDMRVGMSAWGWYLERCF